MLNKNKKARTKHYSRKSHNSAERYVLQANRSEPESAAPFRHEGAFEALQK